MSEISYRDGLKSALEAMTAAGITREQLGREVRELRVAYAINQGDSDPDLTPFSQLSGPDQEMDMLIGEALFGLGWLSTTRRLCAQPGSPSSPDTQRTGL